VAGHHVGVQGLADVDEPGGGITPAHLLVGIRCRGDSGRGHDGLDRRDATQHFESHHLFCFRSAPATRVLDDIT
jgi:hypothetical protein